MERLCRSFQAYLGFPCADLKQSSDEFRFGVNSRSTSKDFVDQKENENKNDDNSDEGGAKKSEKHGDSLSLCEPANRSFESLLESTAVSNTRPYDTVQQNSNHNSCTNDGLRSCTESLGFESSDESEDRSSYVESSFEQHAEFDENACGKELHVVVGADIIDGGIRRSQCYHGHVGAKKGTASFPPPLSSLAPNGQPSVFLKPLRKDGRFLLQEVRLPRHECLQASRQDGRLRLQLVLPTEQPELSRDGIIGQAGEPAKESDTCTASECGGEKWAASLEEKRVHVDYLRREGAADASLALYQEALGRSCHNNTKCMTSTWKPRCIAI